MAEHPSPAPVIGDPAAFTHNEVLETRDPAQTEAYRPAEEATAQTPTVPGYEIEGVLGRGGMGIVYRARHLALKRTVALKMLLGGGHAAEHLRERFRIEGEAVARLQHPHIVQIYEVGEHEGLPYFSLEFVDGPSLQARLRDNPLPPEKAARLLEVLCRAIEAAHQAGVIHRDLKPGNILLTRDGSPKVADFGLAKAIDEDSAQTQSGQILGTPSYMAPEQASGALNVIGPATDVYALGAVLYEMLTGRPPFRGANIADTLDLVRSREPIPPVELQPRVPQDLNTICLKCLQKEPHRRYASARELGDDLRRYLDGQPILARRISRLERLARWRRRNPATAALSLAIALLLVVTTIAAVIEVVRVRTLNQELEDANEKKDAKAREALKSATEAEEKGELERLAKEREKSAKEKEKEAKLLAVKKQQEAVTMLDRMNVTNGLRRLEQKDPSGALLSFAEALRVNPDNPDRVLVNRQRVSSYLRLVTPLVASVSVKTPVPHVETHSDNRFVEFSPESRFVLFVHATTGKNQPTPFTVVDLVADTQFVSEHAASREMPRPVWGPRGRYLIHLPKGTLTIRDALTGKAVRPEVPDQIGLFPRVRAGGHHLAAGAAGPLALAPLLNPQLMFPYSYFDPVRQNYSTSAVFSFDGSQVLSDNGHSWSLFDVRTGMLLNHGPSARTGDVNRRAYVSPDARFVVALEGNTREGWRLTVTDAQTGLERALPLVQAITLQAFTNEENLFEFSPDGRLFALGCGTEVYLWDMLTAEPATPPLVHPERIHFLRFSPDGRILLTGAAGKPETFRVKTAWFWNTSTGRCLGEPPNKEPFLCDMPTRYSQAGHTLGFSPQGDYFLARGLGKWQMWSLNTFTTVDAEVPALTATGADGLPLDRFTPDGRSFLSVASLPEGERELRLIHLLDLKKVQRRWPLDKEGQVEYRLSPDGRRIALARQGEVRVYDMESDEPVVLRPLNGQSVQPAEFGRSPSFVWAPNSRHLLLRERTSFWVWDTERRPLPIIDGPISDSWLAADGSEGRVLLTGPDGTVRMYNPVTSEPLSPPWKPERGVSRAWLSQDGKRVFTLSKDALAGGGWQQDLGTEVQVWDSRTGKAVFSPFRHRSAEASRTTVACNGLRAATTQDGGAIQLWDVGTLAPSGLPYREEGGVKDIEFTPWGDLLRLTRKDGRVVLLRPTSTGSGPYPRGFHEPAVGLKPASVPLPLEGPADVFQFQASSSARALILTDERTAQVVDGITGEPIGEPLVPGGVIVESQLDLDLSHAAQGVVLGDDKGHVLFSRVQNGKWKTHVETLEAGPVRLKYPPQNVPGLIAIAGKEVRVFDSMDRPLTPPLRHESAVGDVLLPSPHSPAPTVITLCGKEVFVWDGKTGKLRHGPWKHDAPITGLEAISENYLLTASGREVRLWDLDKGVIVGKPLMSDGPVRHVWGHATYEPKRPRVYVVTDKSIQGHDVVAEKTIGKTVTLDQPSTAFVRVVPFAAVAAGNKVWVHSSTSGDDSLELIEYKSRIVHATTPPRSTFMFTATEDGTFSWFNFNSPKELNQRLECGRGITFWHMDGMTQRLLTADKEGHLRQWDLYQKKQAEAWKINEPIAEAEVYANRVLVRTQNGKLAIFQQHSPEAINLPVAHKVLRAASGNSYQPVMATRVVERVGREVRLWQTDADKRVGTALLHDEPVKDVRTLENNSILLTRTDAGTLRTWDPLTGLPLSPPLRVDEARRPERTMQGQSSLKLWVTWKARDVVVWDLLQGKALRVLTSDDPVVAAELLDQTVFAVMAGKTARFWDVKTGQPVSQPLVHPAPIRMGFFAWNSLYTITTEEELRVWSQGRMVFQPLRFKVPIREIVTVNQQEAHILTDRAAQRWNLATGQLVSSVPLAGKATGWKVDPNSGSCVITYEDGSAAALQTTQDVGVFPPRMTLRLTPLRLAHRIVQAESSPDDRTLFTRGSDETVQLWDLERGRALPGLLRHEQGTLTEARFLQNGRRVMTVGQKRMLWDARTGEHLTELPDHTHPVQADSAVDAAYWELYRTQNERIDLATGQRRPAKFPKDWQPAWQVGRGNMMLLVRTAKESKDVEEAQLWDDAREQTVGSVMRIPFGLLGGALSQDGKRLALATQPQLRQGQPGDNFEAINPQPGVRVWDTATGQVLTPALPVSIDRGKYSFTPDGSCLLIVRDSEARLWDASTGDPVSPVLRVPADVSMIRFSDDAGRLLLAGPKQAIVHTLSTPWKNEDLIRFAQAASGRRLDETGEFHRLRGAEIHQALKELDQSSADRGEAREKRQRLWHEEQIARAVRNGDEAAVLSHINSLLALGGDPHPLLSRRAEQLIRLGRWNAARQTLDLALAERNKDPALWHLRGEVRIGAEQWGAAGEDLAKAISLPGAGASAWVDHAILALSRGDTETCRRDGITLLERFGKSDDPHVRLDVLCVCLLVRGGGDPEKLAELARGLEDVPDFTQASAVLLGLAYYRAGKLEQAAAAMQAALPRHADFTFPVLPPSGLASNFLLAINRKLGRTAQPLQPNPPFPAFPQPFMAGQNILPSPRLRGWRINPIHGQLTRELAELEKKP